MNSLLLQMVRMGQRHSLLIQFLGPLQPKNKSLRNLRDSCKVPLMGTMSVYSLMDRLVPVRLIQYRVLSLCQVSHLEL